MAIVEVMKSLCRLETDRIRIYRLKSKPRQMVSVSSRLYRVDDDLMIRDIRTDDCMVIYSIDYSQPWLTTPRLVDPDETRCLIDSASRSGSKKRIWQRLDASKTWEWLTVAIVICALLYGFLGAVRRSITAGWTGSAGTPRSPTGAGAWPTASASASGTGGSGS